MVITRECDIPTTSYVPCWPDLGEYYALGIPRPLTLGETPNVPLVQWVKDRQKRFGPGKVDQYLTINPYINQLGGGTLLQGDDSYAGTGWMYPAMKVEGLACQVLGIGFG